MKFRIQKLDNGNCNFQNLKITIPISSVFNYIPTVIILGLTCLVYIMSTCVLVLAGITTSVIVILWTLIFFAIPAHSYLLIVKQKHKVEKKKEFHNYLLLPGNQPDEKQIINRVRRIPSIGSHSRPEKEI